MRHIEQKEFDEWLTHPVTVAVKALYGERREILKECWANGEFSYATNEATALRNAEKIGEVTAYRHISELSYEDYQTEKDNDERVGAEPEGESRVD